MNTSTVKTVVPKGSFENEYGALQDNSELPLHGKKLLYKFEYTMENGITLTANHKTNTSPFPAGSPVDYEVTKEDDKHGKSGKVKKPEQAQHSAPSDGGGNSDVQLMIVRQSSLKVAFDLIHHNCIADDKKVEATAVMQLADIFTEYVMKSK